MSFDIRFSPRAETTFDDIIIKLESRWGDKFVNKFKEKVSKSLDLIAETPLVFQYLVKIRHYENVFCIKTAHCSIGYTMIRLRLFTFGIIG